MLNLRNQRFDHLGLVLKLSLQKFLLIPETPQHHWTHLLLGVLVCRSPLSLISHAIRFRELEHRQTVIEVRIVPVADELPFDFVAEMRFEGTDRRAQIQIPSCFTLEQFFNFVEMGFAKIEIDF